MLRWKSLLTMPRRTRRPWKTKLVWQWEPVTTLFINVVVRKMHLGPLWLKNLWMVVGLLRLSLPRAWLTRQEQFPPLRDP